MIATTKKINDTCGKCDGKGVIQAFRHIAHGTCFWCKGTGILTVSQTEIAKLSNLTVRRIEWLNTVSPEKYATLSLEKMDEVDKDVYACGGLYQDLVVTRYSSVLRPIFFAASKRYWAEQKFNNTPIYQSLGYAN